MRRFITGIITGAALIFMAIPVLAADTWKGVMWYDPFGSCKVNVDKELEVFTSLCGTTSCWGAAYHSPSNAFRTAAKPWVAVTFFDEGPGMPGPQLWMQDEAYGQPDGKGPWTQFGAWQHEGYESYRINWWNHDTEHYGSIDTGIFRSSGEHTLLVGKKGDGTVDYWLDGMLVYSTSNICSKSFGNIYLSGHRDPSSIKVKVIFKDFKTGTDYSPPVDCVERITEAAQPVSFYGKTRSNKLQ